MTNKRKALQVREGAVVSVLSESKFATEAVLHTAIADHPEALPHEDFGLGPMITVANELQLSAGPLDLLLVDPQGRLALCEFKKGSENPDVRKVLAQLLDYGACLWQLGYEELEALAKNARPGFEASLVEYADARFMETGVCLFDPDAFRLGVESSLKSGAFVFLYVVRDIDPKTLRIMTYLAEGPRMSFFGVEVDNFTSENGDSLLVPRTVFVPSWVHESRLIPGDPDATRLMTLMDGLAEQLSIKVVVTETGKRYGGPGNSYIGVYRSSRGVEFNMQALGTIGHEPLAKALIARLEKWTGHPLQGTGNYPNFRCDKVVADWDFVKEMIIQPFLTADCMSTSFSDNVDSRRLGPAEVESP